MSVGLFSNRKRSNRWWHSRFAGACKRNRCRSGFPADCRRICSSKRNFKRYHDRCGWTGYFAYAANTSYGNSIVADPKYKVVKEYPRVAIPKVDANTSEVRSLGVVEYEDFVFCVTHLDHMSIEARKSGVEYQKGGSHAVHSTTTTDITKASDHYPIYADITFKAQK